MPVSLPVSTDAPDDKARRALQLLVVDDDAAQRSLISVTANQAGHAVTVAQSCAEALTQLGNGRLDYVTLDLMLGDGDGIQILQAIADAKFAGSVIVISGMDAGRAVICTIAGDRPAKSSEARRPRRLADLPRQPWQDRDGLAGRPHMGRRRRRQRDSAPPVLTPAKGDDERVACHLAV
jgi:CheY-like chemotaxis protein